MLPEFNAPSDDNHNAVEEYVCFTNRGGEFVGMAGWVVKDEHGWTPVPARAYTFPAFTLDPGASVRVRMGCGIRHKARPVLVQGWVRHLERQWGYRAPIQRCRQSRRPVYVLSPHKLYLRALGDGRPGRGGRQPASGEAVAVVVGVVCGVLAGIPTAVLMLVIMRAQQRKGVDERPVPPPAQYPPVIVVGGMPQQVPPAREAGSVDGSWRALEEPRQEFRVIGEE